MKRLVSLLSLRSLLQRPLELFCNLTLIVGVVVPLLAVLGAKNGINDGLLDRLTTRAGLLSIQTTGNAIVTQEQRDQIAALDGVVFATLTVRSGTDFLLTNAPGPGLRVNARLRITGANDPLLDDLDPPELGQTILSASLSNRLGLKPGQTIEASTGADGRLRHAFTELSIVGTLPPDQLTGEVMLLPLSFMDQLEAYTEGYAVANLNVPDGLDLSLRVPSYEGLFVTVAKLSDVAPVAANIEKQLNRTTRSEERLITETLTTISYLNRAFQIIAILGACGVGAALIASQINAVSNQRRALATLMLLGMPRKDMAVFPVLPALLTTLGGVAASVGVYFALKAGLNASSTSTPIVLRLNPTDLAGLVAASIVIAGFSALFAMRALLSVDPAIILREAS